MVSVEMTSVMVTNLQIINKIKSTKGKDIQLEIKRTLKPYEKRNLIQGICRADMFLKEETNSDKSFLVSIEVAGEFCVIQDASTSHDELRDTVMKELLPYLRACMASAMAISGLPPYLIPTAYIANNEGI